MVNCIGDKTLPEPAGGLGAHEYATGGARDWSPICKGSVSSTVSLVLVLGGGCRCRAANILDPTAAICSIHEICGQDGICLAKLVQGVVSRMDPQLGKKEKIP